MLKNNHLTSLCAVILAATALLFTSCVPENVGPDADLPKGAIRLTAPGYTPQNGSKLGVDSVGAQVFFAAGDRLWVNGVELTIAVNNGVAYITLPDTVSYPIRMVYPYDIVDPNYTYDSESDNIPIKLPSEYTYATVQNGPGAGRQNVPAPLCAKINNSNASITEAFFQHITAAITIAIENKTGAPMELEKIVVKSVARWKTWGEHTINITNPNIDGAYNNSNGGNETKMSFPANSCLLENNGRTYIQIPILQLYNPENTNQKTKLQIGVLAKNKLPGVIANKFYFEKTQANEAFTISKGYLAYAPAYFDIDMESTDPNYGLVVDGTYSIGTDANGKHLKVYFAQGNLKYNIGTPTEVYNDNRWAFANNQYETHENITSNKTTGYNQATNDGWAMLFLYGANGHNPDDTASHHPQFAPTGMVNTHYYGPLTRDNGADWGVRMEGRWITLTAEQWQYLLNNHNKALDKSVNNVGGMIVYPDKFGETSSLTSSFDITFSTGVYTGSDWNTYENQGVLFLPGTGYIMGTRLSQNGRTWYNKLAGYTGESSGSIGSYWTSSAANNTAKALNFTCGSASEPTFEDDKNTTSRPISNQSSIINLNQKSRAVRLAYPANF